MRISTKGRYALRMMLEFALNTDPNSCTKINQVAVRQNISEKYLEQIVSVLVKAGYVQSIRGAKGGYRLMRKPEEYTVGMILRLTEGSLAPVTCLDDPSMPCERSNSCVTLGVWTQLNDAINQVVDHVTLADLVKEQLTKPGYNLM